MLLGTGGAYDCCGIFEVAGVWILIFANKSIPLAADDCVVGIMFMVVPDPPRFDDNRAISACVCLSCCSRLF